ncbi:MAG: hypothetical protein ACHQAZ_09540, partial [Gammaproteobacteria bacterium]
IIRKASGESLDLKPYEADMRHLIDTYIEADEPRKISPFDNIGLMELIVLNIGFDLKVIPQDVFSMLVVMAVVTSAMTGPILRVLLPRMGHAVPTGVEA